MASTDSISLFTEGTFEEQIQELVNYTLRNGSDEERAASIRPFQEALKTQEGASLSDDQKRKILLMVLEHVKGFGEGSEKEIEGFYNLLYAHLLTSFSPDSPELGEAITALLERITSSPPSQLALKYRTMTNLFNALPRTSGLRPLVYGTLLQIAVGNEDLGTLQLSEETVETWLSEWDLTPEGKSAFLKSLVDAYAAWADPQTSYHYKLSYTRSLSPSSDEAQKSALDAIATALRLPSVYELDHLLKVDAVVALKDHELFSLLQIFLNNGLPEFKSWESSHSDSFAKYDLDKAQLEHKIRLLTLTSLSFQYVGQNIPYTKIAEVLQIDVSEVEQWVIDAVRSGLITGKLSQTGQVLHVTRATARTFEKEQWAVLEQRLVAWKAGLSNVLDVVAGARGGKAIPV